MKRMISMVMGLVLALAIFPVQVFAASYPQEYDVKFVLQNGEVVESFEDISYLNAVDVPAYLEVETWYCGALDMEVQTGEKVWADDFDMDPTVTFVADSVLPESFTLNFKLPNGVELGNAVLEPENFYDFYTVPAVDGADVEWTCGDIVLYGNDAITGQDLDLDYVWYEANPVLNFELTSEAVYPDAFTVRFIDDNDVVVSEQVLDFWSFYSAVEIPEGFWMNHRQDYIISDNDYISGQTLDWDFTWYGSHPVVDFYTIEFE